MLLYSRKDVISVSFKGKQCFDEYEEEEKFNSYTDDYYDIFDELDNHINITYSLDELNFDSFDDGEFITECDYCGCKIMKDWTHRQKEFKGRVFQKYKNPNSEFPFTDDCCRKCIGKKHRIGYFIKYGVAYNMKAVETMEKNGKVPTSRQQIYLNNLLNGEMNKHFKSVGFVDILLEESKVILEYDGSGHYLGTEFGRYTYEEKLQQDYDRDKSLRSLGYRIIRIHSEYDYLPSDEVILKEIENIIDKMNNTGAEFYKWVIPKSKKDKRYGSLREIKEYDLDRVV